MRRNYL